MLAFLRVFGEIAVTARAEELHCAALRRQRSEVRILSGAPLLASIPAERKAVRPVRTIAGVHRFDAFNNPLKLDVVFVVH